MKKLLGSLSTGLLFLSAASPAFAQFSINPCTTEGVNAPNSGQFINSLCTIDAGSTGGVIRSVIIAILVIAALLALFFLIWGGIRWILSGGDKGKVEAARNTIIAAIIGLIIAFLAYFILSLILNLFGLSFNNLELPRIIP